MGRNDLPASDSRRAYICIDLKSYYASVECVHRGLDPLKANLLVADEARSDQTICLAVSPSLKAIGVPSRPRLFEAKRAIRKYERERGRKVDYIIAVPRMAEYERISARIYGIYLRYAAPEDILRFCDALDAFAKKGAICVVAPGPALQKCPDLEVADL